MEKIINFLRANKKLVAVVAGVLLVMLVSIIFLYYKTKLKKESTEPVVDSSVAPAVISPTQASDEIGNVDETEFNGTRLLSEEEVDEINSNTALEKLKAVTPFYCTDFAVEYIESENTFEVILFAILNRESQLEQYKEDLRKFKYEALAWITQQGVNIYDINIRYLPEEAKDM